MNVWAEKCAVVIPCLNEAATIYDLVSVATKYLPTIIVVDDGSKDSTYAEATRAGAIVLRHPIPLGKGASLSAGLKEALERKFCWAITMDGDGQHDPHAIPQFLAAAQSTGAQMVIGNRMNDPDTMPFTRRVVNRWMSKRLSKFCGLEVPDSQCGFRLIHLPSWADFTFIAHHFEIESELLVRFATAGLSIAFVPVHTRYANECSKIHPLRDTFRWFAWLRRTRFEFRDHRDSAIIGHDRAFCSSPPSPPVSPLSGS